MDWAVGAEGTSSAVEPRQGRHDAEADPDDAVSTQRIAEATFERPNILVGNGYGGTLTVVTHW